MLPATLNRRTHRERSLKTFLASLPGHITLATVTPRDIAGSLFLKTRMGKLRFTAMAVNASVKRDDILVDVLHVYLIRQWTLTLVSCELFSMSSGKLH